MKSRLEELTSEATLTGKGQVTIPKAVRQVLGLVAGSKVAFALRDGAVMITRAESSGEEDPALAAFLSLLENDISTGKRVGPLPHALRDALLENLDSTVDLDEPIEGDVCL